jgi:MoxR-like ATPase
MTTKVVQNFIMVILTKIQHFFMCSLRNIEFLVSYWLLSKLLDRTLKLNFSTPVKDESDMELNTKVEDYEILHMLTKL